MPEAPSFEDFAFRDTYDDLPCNTITVWHVQRFQFLQEYALITLGHKLGLVCFISSITEVFLQWWKLRHLSFDNFLGNYLYIRIKKSL